MNYIEILNTIHTNSHKDENGELVISEYEFHKLAEDLNTLFAKRIVGVTLKEKNAPTFERWAESRGYYRKMTGWFNKHGYERDYNDLIEMYEDYINL